MNPVVERLRRTVIDPLKRQFVGRDEVIDLIALACVSGEHLFLYGPPGTAKSALVRAFAGAVRGQYFEYLLTRFSEPNELFGPVDLVKLREGIVTSVTAGMLPEAEFAFLDELFNANSAILNNLLTVLNERVYRRGAETHQLRLVSTFAASNNLPEEETLAALFDRFLLRCRVEPLPREQLPALLAAGWALEQPQPPHHDGQAPTAEDLRELARLARRVELASVLESYADLVEKIRNLGVQFSDRRAVKMLKVVAASAVLCGRSAANSSDFWVLRYAWDRAEQIGPLASLVHGILEQAPREQTHELARPREQVDAEALARELTHLEETLKGRQIKLLEAARVKEQLRSVGERAAWVADAAAREFVLSRVRKLTELLT